MKKIAVLVLALFLLALQPLFAASASVPTMDKDEVKSLLGTDNTVILDVRISRDWESSDKKIKGAVRMDGFDLPFLEKYPKDTPLLSYCA